MTERDPTTGAIIHVLSAPRFGFDGPTAITTTDSKVWVRNFSDWSVTELFLTMTRCFKLRPSLVGRSLTRSRAIAIRTGGDERGAGPCPGIDPRSYTIRIPNARYVAEARASKLVRARSCSPAVAATMPS